VSSTTIPRLTAIRIDGPTLFWPTSRPHAPNATSQEGAVLVPLSKCGDASTIRDPIRYSPSQSTHMLRTPRKLMVTRHGSDDGVGQLPSQPVMCTVVTI
jgi:hypothetical protein